MKMEIYKIDFGGGSIYLRALNGREVVCRDKTVAMSRKRLLAFIDTAQELGLKAGKL